MVEEKRYERKWFDRNFLPVSVGISIFGVVAVPWYVHERVNNSGHDEFFKNPVVTMESHVVGERYVQPSNSPSKYFLSIDDVMRGRVTVEVIDADGVGLAYGINSPISKESIDARVDIEIG